MDWKSNFTKDEIRRIKQILRYHRQVGYKEGSDLHILSVMVSILDNAESVVNGEEENSILQNDK